MECYHSHINGYFASNSGLPIWLFPVGNYLNDNTGFLVGTGSSDANKPIGTNSTDG